MSSCDFGQLIFRTIEEYDAVNEDVFKNILRTNKPALLKNCSFGQCMDKWNLDYLTDSLADQQVVIHVSSNMELDFLAKNFAYQSCAFSRFAEMLKTENSVEQSNSHVYLRSTTNNPRDRKPARIEDDFLNISNDLRPPSFIPFGSDNELYHSSVLRIASSNVQIWTHFDLYDNVLCQTHGTKRIILLPPEDIRYLYTRGDKSLVNDFDNWNECLKSFPLIRHSTPYKCILRPGDALYLPALWWHNIRTINEPATKNDTSGSSGHSIGFNIFWKDREIASHYAARDVYGNKHLQPVEYAFENLDKALNHINKLPGKYNLFYKNVMLDRLKSRLFPNESIETDEST